MNNINMQQVLGIKTNSAIFQLFTKTFFKAAVYFLVMGLMSFTASYFLGISNRFFANFSGSLLSFRAGLFGIMVFVIGLVFGSIYLQRQWEKNIEHASNGLIVANYCVSFLFSFIILTPGLFLLSNFDASLVIKNNNFLQIADQNRVFLGSLIKMYAIVFLLTFLLYAIPAVIGFVIQKTKTIHTIGRVLFFVSIINLVVLAVIVLTSFFGSRHSFGNGLSAIFFVLLGVVIFLSPILTIYRMRRVYGVLDLHNAQVNQKWVSYFTFVIFRSLVEIAWFLTNLLLRLRR